MGEPHVLPNEEKGVGFGFMPCLKKINPMKQKNWNRCRSVGWGGLLGETSSHCSAAVSALAP